MTPVNQEETNNIELRKETEMIKRIKITGNYGYTTERKSMTSTRTTTAS